MPSPGLTGTAPRSKSPALKIHSGKIVAMSDGMEPLPDTWTSRDLPLLRRIAESVESDGPPVDAAEVGWELGLSPRETDTAARALESGGYISGLAWEGGSVPPLISGITGTARKAVGLWPSHEVGYERLLAKLDELIAASTPQERTRLQRARDALVAGGGQVGVALAGAVLGGAVGA